MYPEVKVTLENVKKSFGNTRLGTLGKMDGRFPVVEAGRSPLSSCLVTEGQVPASRLR